MIKILPAENKVTVQLKVQTSQGEKLISFSNERTSVFDALIVRDKLTDDLYHFIEKIRKDAYNEGWKDKASKKITKRERFSGWI